jgi:DNA-directed RNA polymerase subunit RPC12/RpoP
MSNQVNLFCMDCGRSLQRVGGVGRCTYCSPQYFKRTEVDLVEKAPELVTIVIPKE